MSALLPKPSLPPALGYELPTESELPTSRAPWTLRPERAAILVHDMQRYFMRAFAPGAAPIAVVIENLRRLIVAARGRDVPVFYTAQVGNQELAERGLQSDLWGPGMTRMPEHTDIVAALAPTSGDIVLTKHRYSAFQRSEFADRLRLLGRDQLVIGGVYAHIGCLLTAAEAFQLDFQPFVLSDGTADFSRAWHDAALAEVADCCGVVHSTRRVLEALR